MDHKYYYGYRNVAIRPLAEADIESLRGWRNDGSNTRFLRKLPYITEDMQKEWFGRYLADSDEYCFAVDETETLKRLVGSLSLYNFSAGRAEFGKILIGEPEAHGREVGCNSIRAVLHIAFGEMKLERVFLRVYTENKGAVHIYTKVGFTVTDTHDADGREEYFMEITRERYLALYGE